MPTSRLYVPMENKMIHYQKNYARDYRYKYSTPIRGSKCKRKITGEDQCTTNFRVVECIECLRIVVKERNDKLAKDTETFNELVTYLNRLETSKSN